MDGEKKKIREGENIPKEGTKAGTENFWKEVEQGRPGENFCTPVPF